jgi:hypothetical protein
MDMFMLLALLCAFLFGMAAGAWLKWRHNAATNELRLGAYSVGGLPGAQRQKNGACEQGSA